MNTRIRSGLLAATIAIAATILATPTHAGASNAYVNFNGTLLYFETGSGETNDLTVNLEGAEFVITDPGATITPGTGCAAVTTSQIKCTAAPVRDLDLRLGNLDDRASIGGSVAGLSEVDDFMAEIEGGNGNDTITGGPGIRNQIYGDDSFFGGTGNDSLTGGSADDSLFGQSGNDSLASGGGDDELSGGPGNDLVDGGAGADQIEEGMAANGADRLDGGSGENRLSYRDRQAGVTISENGVADDGEAGEGDNVLGRFQSISTGDGNDIVTGTGQRMSYSAGDGDDKVSAGDGSDQISGGNGDDMLSGAAGRDQLVGGDGNDEVDGGPGDDSIFDGSDEVVDAGDDQYRGGPGTDLLLYSTTVPLTVDLDGVADDGRPGESDLAGTDLEDLIGGPKADTLVGNGSANRIDGGPGNDRISGLAGPDGLFGRAGDDQLDGGQGIDVIDGAVGADQIRSRDRNPDEIHCGSSADTLLADSLDEFTVTCDRSSIGAAIRARKARFNRRGKTRLRVNCPALEGITCKVRIVARKGKKALARGGGRVKPGTTGKVRLKLTRAGKRRRARKLVLKVRATFTDAAGTRVSTDRRMSALKARIRTGARRSR